MPHIPSPIQIAPKIFFVVGLSFILVVFEAFGLADF